MVARQKMLKILAVSVVAVFVAGAATAGQEGVVVVRPSGKAANVSGEAEGVIKGVDAGEHKIRIDHGPIEGTLEMMGMTMAFKVAPDIDLSKVKTGDKVKFTVTRDEKGLFLVEKMEPSK